MTLKKTILIIDEDLSRRTLLGIMLEMNGKFQTLKTHNAEAAFNVLAKTRPDLILLDIDAHSMNGIELCRTLRTHPNTNAVPILILSSRGDADSVMRGLQAGANDYLPKPILHHELIAKVKALLAANPARR